MWYAFHTYPLTFLTGSGRFPLLENQKTFLILKCAQIRSKCQNQTFQPYMCQIFYSQKISNEQKLKKKYCKQIVISAQGPCRSAECVFVEAVASLFS